MHLVPLSLPDREAGTGITVLNKYVVVLRGGQPAESEVPVVVASTDRRRPGQPVRTFEVSVGTGDGFTHATLVDCRWVHTIPKSDLSAETYRFNLSPQVMERVAVALVSGLQMR